MKPVKYFFLSDGWDVGRVWEFGGLWSEATWRRRPDIQRLNLCVLEQGEKLWLYRVEEDVIMVEVRPGFTGVDRNLEADLETNPDVETTSKSPPTNPQINPIGKVVLKRLITAEQAIDYINKSSTLP